MASFDQQYSESLISSLSYTLGKTSSAIVDRQETKVPPPRGGTSYTPRGAQTIEFTVTDSGSYVLLNTIRCNAKLQAHDPVNVGNQAAVPAGDAALPHYELSMLGPAHAIIFQSCSRKIAGV